MSAPARLRAFVRRHPAFGALVLLQFLVVAALAAAALRPLTVCSIPLETLASSSSGEASAAAPVALPAGGYRVEIEYRDAAAPQADDASANSMLGTLQFASAAQPTAVRCDAIALSDVFTRSTARLWIATASEVQDLTMTLTPAQGRTLTLQSVTLTEQPAWRGMTLLGWGLLFAAADALVWLLFLGDGARMLRGGAVPLLLAGGILLASLPFGANFLYTGHDLRFHCYRIWALAQSLAEGQFPVRMFTAGFNGYGAATPQYYCDLFLYLPALLYRAFMPLQACYQVYVVLCNAATMLLAYYSFARISGHKLYGAAAAFAYTLCAYRLTNLLLRAAVGEYTAMMFLPLVALGAWAIARQPHPAARDWLPLALGMAGIVQSHLLTALLAAAFLAVFWLACLPAMLRPPRLRAAAKAAAVAAGLSAWFLLPCVDALRHERVMVSDVQPAPIQNTGVYPIQQFALFGQAGGSSGTGATTNGVMPLTVGLAGVLVLALALWCCLRRRLWRQTPGQTQHWQDLRGALALCLGALGCASIYFPWDWLTARLPQAIAGLLLKPQFTWRYLGVAAVLLGGAAAVALALLHSVSPRRARAAAAALVAATLLYTGVFYQDLAAEHGTMTLDSVETMADFPYESMGYDYLPAGVDLAQFDTVQAVPQQPEVTAVWQAGGSALCENPTQAEAAVDLPVLAYRYYRAVDAQTGAELPLTQNEQHCLRVTLPAGYRGTVQVRYVPPVSWHLAEAVTLLTLLGLAGGALYDRKRRTAV